MAAATSSRERTNPVDASGQRQNLGGLFIEILRDPSVGAQDASQIASLLPPRSPSVSIRSRQPTYVNAASTVQAVRSVVRDLDTGRMFNTFSDPTVERDYVIFALSTPEGKVLMALVCCLHSAAMAFTRGHSPTRSSLGIEGSSLTTGFIVASAVWLLIAIISYWAPVRNAKALQRRSDGSDAGDAVKSDSESGEHLSQTSSSEEGPTEIGTCDFRGTFGSYVTEYLCAAALCGFCMLLAAAPITTDVDNICTESINVDRTWGGAIDPNAPGIWCHPAPAALDRGMLLMLVLAFRPRPIIAVPAILVYAVFVIVANFTSSYGGSSEQLVVLATIILEIGVAGFFAIARDQDARSKFVQRQELAERLITARATFELIQDAALQALPENCALLIPGVGIDFGVLMLSKSQTLVMVGRLASFDVAVGLGLSTQLREAVAIKHALILNIDNHAKALHVTRVGFLGDTMWATSDLIDGADTDNMTGEPLSVALADSTYRICVFAKRCHAILNALLKNQTNSLAQESWKDVKFKMGIELGPAQGILTSSYGPPTLSVHGRAVRVAARLADLADEGATVMTERVKNYARRNFMTMDLSSIKVEGEFARLYTLGVAHSAADETTSTHIPTSPRLSSPSVRKSTDTFSASNTTDETSATGSQRGVTRLLVASNPMKAVPDSPTASMARSSASSQSSAGRYQTHDPTYGGDAAPALVLLSEIKAGDSRSTQGHPVTIRLDEIVLSRVLRVGGTGFGDDERYTVSALKGYFLLGRAFDDAAAEAEYRSSGNTSDVTVTAVPIAALCLVSLIVQGIFGPKDWRTFVVLAGVLLLTAVGGCYARRLRFGALSHFVTRFFIVAAVLAIWGALFKWDASHGYFTFSDAVTTLVAIALASRTAVFLPSTFPLALDFAMVNVATQAMAYVAAGHTDFLGQRLFQLALTILIQLAVSRAADDAGRQAQLGVVETENALQHCNGARDRATIAIRRLLPQSCAEFICEHGQVAHSDVTVAQNAIVLVLLVRPAASLSLANSPSGTPRSKPQDGGFGAARREYGMPPISVTPEQHRFLDSRASSMLRPPPSAGQQTLPPGTAQTAMMPGSAAGRHTRRIDSDMGFTLIKRHSSKNSAVSDNPDFMPPRMQRNPGPHTSHNAIRADESVDSIDDIHALLEGDDQRPASRSPGASAVVRRHGELHRTDSANTVRTMNTMPDTSGLRASTPPGQHDLERPCTDIPRSPTLAAADTLMPLPDRLSPQVVEIIPTHKTELTITPQDESEAARLVSMALDADPLVSGGSIFVTRSADAWILVANFSVTGTAECSGHELLQIGRSLSAHPELRAMGYSVKGGLCTGALSGAFVGGECRLYDLVGPTLKRASELARDAADGAFYSAATPAAQAKKHLADAASRSVSACSSMSQISLHGEFVTN